MPTLRRRITDVAETTEPETGEITRSVTVVDQDDADPVGAVYAAGLLPEPGAELEPAIWRAQRAGQVQRALTFLAVRADAFGWRPGPAGQAVAVLERGDDGLLADPGLLVPASPVGDDTVRCAANILRARPDAPLIEQRHGRLP